MSRGLLVCALLAVTAPCQDPPRELLAAFEQALEGPPGPSRVAAAKALAGAPHPSCLPRFLEALGRAGKQVAAIENQLDGLSRKRARAVRAAGARDEVEAIGELTGDMSFRRRQLRDLSRECQALRDGYRASLATVDVARRGSVLKTLCGRAGRGGSSFALRRQLLELLGDLPASEACATLVRVLGRDRDPLVRGVAADALGRQIAPEAEAALVTALGDEFAVVRAAAVNSLRFVGGRAGVEALIDRLPLEEGRLLDDVIFSLRFLTGENFHDNVVLWKEWWSDQGSSYRRPDRRGERVRRGVDRRQLLAEGNGEGFYGLRFRSHAVVYVIDVSGSMAEKARAAGTTSAGHADETKLDRAKRELIRSLGGLPSGVMVNVLAYSDGVDAFEDDMVKLDGSNRRALIAWVKTLRAHGKTNVYDALETVFKTAAGRRGRPSKRMIVDTLLFLTDGLPTAGQLRDSELICSEVRRMNARARIVIHTIGVGPDHDSDLLKRLSVDSQGTYVRAR